MKGNEGRKMEGTNSLVWITSWREGEGEGRGESLECGLD